MIQLINQKGEELFKVDYETDAEVGLCGASMFISDGGGDYIQADYVTLPIE